MNVISKINIISKEEDLVWSKSFKALLMKFVPNTPNLSNIFQEISFNQITHYTDPSISSKVFIILEHIEELLDNIDLINGLIKIKSAYIIMLKPIDHFKYLIGNYLHSNFYEQSSKNEIQRINPFTIDINSKLWVELVNISSFLRAEEGINTSNTICIAWCSEELNSYRKLLASELQHNGYNVVLLNYNETKEELLNKFKNCEYIIHPFGSHKSEKLSKNNIPSDRFQVEIAAEYVQNNTTQRIKRFVWELPIKSKFDDENHAYLHGLSTDSYLLSGADYLKIDFSKFKSLVIKDIKDKETESSFALLHSNSIINILGIYQDNIDTEVELASQIKYNISPSIQLINMPNSNMKLRMFRSYLVDAEIIIIFYFIVNPKWLKSKFIEITKAPGYGRTKKWMAKYLLTIDSSMIDLDTIDEDFEVVEVKQTNFLRKLQTDIEKIKFIERDTI